MLQLVDEDTAAFNLIMEAFKLPKGTDEEKAARKAAIQAATKKAIEVPFEAMETAYKSMEVMKAMVENGNPNSITDAGVGALCARTAIIGAHMNVRINAAGFNDKAFLEDILGRAAKIEKEAIALEADIIALVNKAISA